jgi:lysophospholipase L1-like esterase
VQKVRLIKWLLITGFCSALVPESIAQDVPKSSWPESVAEDATVDLFNALMLFDHLFMKSTTATSPDYLKRVSDPSSKLYRDYLEYKSGRIDQAELVRRLPHIAMIGDSLSKNFYISSPASMLWRARTERQRDWFLDTDSSPDTIESLYERLNQSTPLVATEYSSPGALVTSNQARIPFWRHLARTQYLASQVTKVTETKRFPDVILLWIGHNNTDWPTFLSEAEQKAPAKHLRQIAQQFGTDYTAELKTLIDRAKAQNHRVAFVVFGLADFKTFFEMRRKAAAAHAGNPALYPYYDKTCQYFPALQPQNQERTTQLGEMLNAEIRKMVATLNRDLKRNSNVRLEYSDALSQINLDYLKGFNRMDAWHPSVLGHDALADTAFKAIAPSLDFVGISRNPLGPVGDRPVQSQTR